MATLKLVPTPGRLSHVGTPRSGFADLTPEHRFFALAVFPQRVAAVRREAAAAGFWRGLMLGLAFGGLGGLWVMTLVLR